MDNVPDPFREARESSGMLPCEFGGESVPMILRHEEVRRAARDWKTYSSNAPFRVPIPSEEDVRTVRQLPVETDPPDHTGYREIVEPFFRRPKDPEVAAQMAALIDAMVADALRRPSVEVVREFALPLQSRTLALLLNMPDAEAGIWIRWGTHVFRDGGSGQKKGAELEAYLNRKLDEAAASPGGDFFSALNQATFRGRPLTREEMLGFANLTFAGGRDTVIHTLSSIFGYFGRHPEALEFLREDPARIVTAGEEFFRLIAPLTHIGRVCPVTTEVHGQAVPPGGRVSLCWASANRDSAVFEAPDEVRLDRRPNAHLSFGSGAHLCLGAAHARLIVRSLLESLTRQVARIQLRSAEERWEVEAAFRRVVGYERLEVSLHPRTGES